MVEGLGYLMKRAQHAFRLAIDEELRCLNLTSAQYGALSALEKMPGTSNAALARATFVTPQTMIEIVKGLEAAGFVRRQSHAQHGRIIMTKLTDQGRANLEAAHQILDGVEEQMLTGIGESERELLAKWLRLCCKNLEVS